MVIHEKNNSGFPGFVDPGDLDCAAVGGCSSNSTTQTTTTSTSMQTITTSMQTTTTVTTPRPTTPTIVPTSPTATTPATTQLLPPVQTAVTVNVSAAASLKGAITDIDTRYTKENPNVTFAANFAGSGPCRSRLNRAHRRMFSFQQGLHKWMRSLKRI